MRDLRVCLASFLALGWGLGCSDDAAVPPLPACSAAIPPGATATEGPGGMATCTDGAPLTASSSADLVVDGYRIIGPAFRVDGAPGPHGIDVVLPVRSAPSGHEADVAILARQGNAPAHAALVSNVVVEGAHGRVHFHVPSGATFQAALPTAMAPKTRHYTFRALAGVSMGGMGSSHNFWRHPDRYDAIGVMGADPGPDLTYTAAAIRDFFLGGFCQADVDGAAKVGQLCPPTRRLLTDQGERGSTFEQLLYEKGEGVGLTLRRSLYLRANRDLARAFGNGAYYNPDSTYLPPGIPAATLALTPAQACATSTVLKKFYDRHYNPDGKLDVITFCDGNDSDAVGYGKLDPATPATTPVQILLAVDVNGNHVRDSGEPVLVQGAEPWRDVGTDGQASTEEPGYDPVNNPDPNGDDYHYLWNPGGTENNWRYDEGEPFEDVGIDGVARTVGGCDAQSGVAQCYDYGEGNGKFDYAPNIVNWRAHDPRSLLEALPAADLLHLDTYYDAGIRDFFNAQVSTNSLMAALLFRREGVHLFDGFPAVVGLAQSKEDRFKVNDVDLNLLGRHVYIRYGDPDLTQAVVEATGDGRHVGTATQAVHRVQLLMSFLAWRWPGGDRRLAPTDAARARVDDHLVTATGRDTPYTVILPPGYFQPENAQLHYPVVYFMHGYGQEPDSLATVTVFVQNAMVDDRVPESRRLQKFILVLVDGKCRPGGDLDGGAPVPTDGDQCEEGTFYSNHAVGTYAGEDMLGELQAKIEADYRTKAPADL
jgi:hypothetical protein